MSYTDLTEESPTIAQPEGLEIKLRPHQLTSIAAMLELERQASIVIDKPNTTTNLYNALCHKVHDKLQFVSSTFMIETNTAILADKVGAGKTYMIFGLILNTRVPQSHNKIVMGTDNFYVRMITGVNTERVNLIVTPHNLVNQWEEFSQNTTLSCVKLSSSSDFNVFFDIEYVTDKTIAAGNLLTLFSKSRKKLTAKQISKIDAMQAKRANKATKTKKVGGSKTARSTATKNSTINNEVYERKILNPKKVRAILNSVDVIILNVRRYALFIQIFRGVQWARVIIDEMDTIPIPMTFSETGNFQWFVTATPRAIFTRSCRKYVGSIFGTGQKNSGSHESLLPYFTVKNCNEYVDKSIVLPDPFAYIVLSKLQVVVAAIKDMIPTEVMNLINAGNMQEAVTKLNCNVETEDNIFNVLTKQIVIRQHNLKNELKYVKTLIEINEESHEKKIKTLIENIGRCKTQLNTIEERIKSIKTECCLICADAFDTPAVMDCCKSIFCLKCLLRSLKSVNNNCPFCRQEIKSNKQYHVISSSKNTVHTKKKSKHTKTFQQMDKADALEVILTGIASNEKTPRILIFSDYAQTFDKIVKNIAKAKLQYSMLSGVPSHITNVINEYNEGKTNVLLLNTKHYGSGLNLQSTQYLILYHRMNTELETQVVGRANRFGRTSPLRVIYMVYEDESRRSNISAKPIMLTDPASLELLYEPPGTKDAKPQSPQENKRTTRSTKGVKKRGRTINLDDDE